MKKKKNLSRAIGDLVRQEESESGIVLQTNDAVLEVQVWAPKVVRVRAQRLEVDRVNSEFSDVSYAVSAQPVPGLHKIIPGEKELRIQTENIDLQVQTHPLRLSFFDRQGRLLGADDPAFGISWMGTEVTNYKVIQPGERFIGMGEKGGGLDRRGSSYEHWNTDAFAYGPDTDPLYTSTPFYIGVLEGRCYGIFLDNSHRTTFNFGASNERFSFFSSPDGDLDYYFIAGDSVAEVVQSYTWLTGRMQLPPLWSLGYQQCRYSYYPDHQVLNVARTFREKKIPADVIYLDIHYMDAFKIFTWHPEHFPHPKKMIDELKAMGFRVVIIVDPGIKREEGYAAYESGLEGDHFVKYPDGTPYHGQVWPGWSAFPDFTRARTREWWGEQFDVYVDAGVEGFWNDMNEPTAWGHSIPDLIEFDYEGEGATHKEARNIYGMQMARATEAGVSKLMPGKRPFILTRAAFSGIQRYSAVWTGDNTASDEMMLAGVRLVNSLGLAGVSFSGYDLSGFFGECGPDLFARWIAIAAFSPFFRGHSMVNSRRSEPWSFGEATEAIARNYIELRYRLLPYLYGAFRESVENGMPVSRSLAFYWPHDPKIYDTTYGNQYLFGQSLLVAAVDSRQHLHKVYLPEGDWYDFFTDQYHPGGQEICFEADLEKLPVFVRAGALIPMQSVVQNVTEKPDEVLEIHVYPGEGEALDYYEDDGESHAHQGGEYYRRSFRFDAAQSRYVISAVTGTYRSRFARVRLCFHALADAPDLSFEGEKLDFVKRERMNLKPIPKFDPLGAPVGEAMVHVAYEVELELVDAEMVIG